MENRFPYSQDGRFIQPRSDGQIISPYDQDSRLFQDMIQRGIEPVIVRTINLGTAGSLSLPQSGFHFVVYGHDNSANKAVNTTALVNVLINRAQDDGSQPFPAKHARGFSGPFAGLYLQWPAQAGVFCDFIIFRGSQKPWIDGESCT